MASENTSTPLSDGLTAASVPIASDSQIQIFREVAIERVRQDVKHGPVPPTRRFGTSRNFAEVAQQAKDYVNKNDDPTWVDILVEEVYEALAEEDWPPLRRELIQVAAVVVSMIEDGDNRNAAKFVRASLREGLKSHRRCAAHGNVLCCPSSGEVQEGTEEAPD